MLTGILILLTLKCTNESDHCFLHCGPSCEATFTIEQLRILIDQIKQLGTINIVYFRRRGVVRGLSLAIGRSGYGAVRWVRCWHRHQTLLGDFGRISSTRSVSL